jgi:hypothetical protein
VHVCPAAVLHAFPQEAQLLFVPSCVSHPSATLPLQLPQPAVHDAIPHAPPVQLGVAWLVLHGVLHAPQWLVLVLVFVSHEGPPATHSAIGAVHAAVTQTPAVHVCPAAVLHALPHLPQWLLLTVRSTSQPLALLPSQLPVVALSHAHFMVALHVWSA